MMRAAKLQDVGMMAIPDAILAKPGPLNEAEWAYIRKHTVIGERIVAAAPPLLPVARLVGRAMSVGTAADTRTVWPASRSRWGHGSCSPATASMP